MEFLKIIKRRSFLHEAVYVVLNIAIAVAALVLVRVTDSFWPALVLVLLSKWRVFAVRPRFWTANIQANLVTTIVSVSYVAFLYMTNIADLPKEQILTFQIFLAMIDIVWLLWIKPQSKRTYVVAQAGVALVAGVTAIYALTYAWPLSLVVLLVWLVGYAATKHVLGSYDDETHEQMLALVGGFCLAEIGWLMYHWTIAYGAPIISGVLIPQPTIIMACLCFLAYKCYDSYYHHERVRLNDIILPLVLTVSIIGILLLLFNGVSIESFR